MTSDEFVNTIIRDYGISSSFVLFSESGGKFRLWGVFNLPLCFILPETFITTSWIFKWRPIKIKWQSGFCDYFHRPSICSQKAEVHVDCEVFLHSRIRYLILLIFIYSPLCIIHLYTIALYYYNIWIPIYSIYIVSFIDIDT